MRRLGLFLVALSSLGGSVQAQINVDQVMSIGRNAIYFNDYVVSIGYFNQVIGLRPWMAEPYFFRSIAKISLDDYEGARSDASMAIERNPFLSKAYLVRGIANYNTGNTAEAIADYQQGISLAPNDIGMRYNLAVAYLEQKKYKDATASVEELLRFSSRNIEAHNLYAGIALAEADTTQALSRLDKTLSLDSTYAPAHLLKAQIYADRKNFPIAEQALSVGIEQGEHRPDLYINRGIMRFHQNNLRGAMQDYSEALSLDPNSKTALHNRALLRLRVGEYQGAIRDWDQLIRLEPENYIARYNRALLLQRQGMLRPALKDLDIVLGRYPSFAEGFSRRAEIRRMLGDMVGSDKDKLHLFDLQNDKAYRAKAVKASKQEPSSTRDQADESIEKYNMLVERKPQNTPLKQQYSSKERGRIQDRDVEVRPQEYFALTYFEELNPNRPNMSTNYSELLERYNTQHRLPHRLRVQSRLTALSATQIELLNQDLREVSELQTAPAYLRKGIDYALLQNFDQAITDFTQAIELDRGTVLAYFGRAVVRLRQQEAQSGQRSPESQSSTSQQIIRGGITSETTPMALPAPALNNYDPLQDLGEVIRLAPQFDYAYYNRALLLASLGEKESALKDYNKAIELNGKIAEAYYNRGLLYLSMGKTKEGVQDLSKAGELGIYQAYNLIKRMNK